MSAEYRLDMHTHTIASGHAYNTILEMAKAASEKGLSMLGITEHTKAMPNGCTDFYLSNLDVVDRNLFGIELWLGVELNILDYHGGVDVSSSILQGLDICIASLHTPCIRPGSIGQNTRALTGAMEHPCVSIIGHPDDGRYPVDFEEVVQAAKENHVLLELNNNSLAPDGFRMNARENDRQMLELCAEYGQPIIIGSDAHWMSLVGRHDRAVELLEEIDFPQELVMNYHLHGFKEYIAGKRRHYRY